MYGPPPDCKGAGDSEWPVINQNTNDATCFSGGQGHPHRDRHNRRSDHHPRAFVDQERQRRARPGDVPDQEGEPMVLRAEGAYRRGVVHSVWTSAASVADKQMLPNLLHGEERKVWGNGGYRGQTDSIHQAAPHAQDMTYRRTKFKNYVDEEARRKNTTKSKVRAKVEHVFRILKRVFGFDRVRYRGIAKNHHRLCANFALINLYLHRKRLAVLGA